MNQPRKKSATRTVSAPSPIGPGAVNRVQSVVVGKDDDVQWTWTRLPGGVQFVSGYTILRGTRAAFRRAALIRPATIADAADIARLSNELGYPATSEQIATRLAGLLGSAAHFIVVAELPPSVVGWIAAERRLLLESGERVEVVGLIVASTAKRAGIGSALVRAAEEWAVAQNLKVISVRSNVARAESHPFYERLGYIRTKTQHAYAKQLSAV